MAETVFIVRHGEAESNRDKYFAGWRDTKLTRLGMDQAALLSRRLVHERIGKAFCSDSLRARQTLENIGLTCPVAYSEALRETNYGKMEGVAWGEDEDKYDRYHLDPSARGEGGENAFDVQKRAVAYFEKNVLDAPEEKVLVVSHHNTIICVACHLLGLPLSNWRRLRVGNCGLSIFTKEDDIWRLKLWNSLSHYGLENFRPLLKKDKKR
jgi:broad specificity phosphatase PhoE